jgi:hypothetical protein
MHVVVFGNILMTFKKKVPTLCFSILVHYHVIYVNLNLLKNFTSLHFLKSDMTQESVLLPRKFIFERRDFGNVSMSLYTQ